MVLMEVSSRSETKSSSGYGKPPWIFKGSALYQLHLVKAETARAFIPKDFKLVEAFGYTLGGFFLASYEDSPAGAFDELVVLAGIVWNPPTSCAWAAKVLVSSEVACEHGRKDVGLPSQVARFSKKTTTAIPRQRKTKFSSFLDMLGFGPKLSSPKDRMDVRVTEIKGPSLTDICNIDLTTPILGVKSDNGMMPTIKISLPSFSGRTVYNPNLLKYTCRMECRLRAVTAAKVSGPCQGPDHDKEESLGQHRKNPVDSTTGEPQDDEQNLSISVMLSKPILALEFGCLKMQVEAPVVISKSSCRRTPLEVS